MHLLLYILKNRWRLRI